MRCLKSGEILILAAIFALTSCTKKEGASNDLSTSPPPVENKLVENTEEKECTARYEMAKNALLALQTSGTPANFRKFRDALPPAEEKIVYCENLRFVLSAFDARLELVKKSAPNKKEYAAFLAKSYPYTDGNMAETVCDEMSKISKVDPESAMRGLKDNKMENPPECFFQAGAEMIDASEAENASDRAIRIKAIERVKAKDLGALKKIALLSVKAPKVEKNNSDDSKEE